MTTDPTPHIATVLVHATSPAHADDARTAIIDLNLDEITHAERVVTAYDVLLVVSFDTEVDLADVVRQVQELDEVARTLTLVHVPQKTDRG